MSSAAAVFSRSLFAVRRLKSLIDLLPI